jgi:hypothetical protein
MRGSKLYNHSTYEPKYKQMKFRQLLLWGFAVTAFCGSACTSLDKTHLDRPVMVGPYIAPGITSDDLNILYEKTLEDNNSETSTTSGDYRINETSSFNGLSPAINIAHQNDMIVMLDWFYISQAFMGIAYNYQYRSAYTYIIQKD